jgi:hypothetical protein
MITDITVPAKRCKCDVCGREWTIYEDNPLPSHCRNQDCRSREWNGKKIHTQSHIHEIKFPSVRERGRRHTTTETIALIDYEEDP